jgi:NitT/TauT family transport system ATP-binding protein
VSQQTETQSLNGKSGESNSRLTALSAQDVSLVYPLSGSNREKRRSSSEPKYALKNVSLDVPEGQFIALVGASGCGKTSLLNLFTNLVQPTNGTVLVRGDAPRLSNPGVGYMWARDALLPWRTAIGNVELALEARGLSQSERTERSAALLSMVGLAGSEKLYRKQLSHGMRQRVALARTLAPDPTILLMDEPFGALDAHTKLHLQMEFLRIWEEKFLDTGSHTTVLFVTHDLGEAALLADRVIVMHPNPGRITYDALVDLPRPRSRLVKEIMFSDEYRLLHEELFRQLQVRVEEPSS